MVAIYSLGDNMSYEVDRQAASLLGADLEISTNKQVSPGIRKMADSLADRRSEQQSFTSMIYFPKNEGTRLVQVHALSGEFPYYGKLETLPASAGLSFRKEQAALVDQTVNVTVQRKGGRHCKAW
jgi:putative ABC transport system permease protein